MTGLQIVATEKGDGGLEINVWHGHTWVGEGTIGDMGYIHSVGTNERYRRRGVARFVVNELAKHGQVKGLKSVYLNTYAGKEGDGARKCYKQVGFKLKPDLRNMELTFKKWQAPELTINEDNLPDPIVVTRHWGNIERTCRVREGDVVERTDLKILPGTMLTPGIVVGTYTNDTPETDLVTVRFRTNVHYMENEEYSPSITIYGGKLKIKTCGLRVGDKVRMIHEDPKHGRKGTNYIGDHPEVLNGIATVTAIGGRYGGEVKDKNRINGDEGGTAFAIYDTGFTAQRSNYDWERIDE